MQFFSHFDIVKKEKNYSIRYKRKTFALLNIEQFSKVVIDNVTIGMRDSLLKQSLKKVSNTPLESKALQLEKIYTREKRKFHKNNKIKHIGNKTKEFTHFIKAVEIIRRHKTKNMEFIAAQVKGLAFINNYKGSFPKPNQLATPAAEDRLLDYFQATRGTGTSDIVERIELKHFDKTTALMENPSFVAKWELLEDGKAELRDAYFIKDCMIARNGRVTKVVSTYIKELEAEE